ncbi:trithorax group protein osa [Scaptodrosophila lebanonensis]|uniref:Trithorax group protein osa n=1 Tax=Drosophila lebanonensis TaxID=7225 RepID=A0A6J2UIY9_DROLE|nr:trithorax group protein osa [Scaptodrosophila lebanonensis]
MASEQLQKKVALAPHKRRPRQAGSKQSSNGTVTKMKSSAVYVSNVGVLLLLLVSGQAQPVQERESRQMKSGAPTEADLKMMAANSANGTPPAPMQPGMPVQLGMPMAMAGLQMPINQLALNAASMQLARYPSYPGIFYGSGLAPGATSLPNVQLQGPLPGLQGNLAAAYPTNFDAGTLPGSFSGAPGAFGFGYPGNTAGFMFGNVYPSAQLQPNGFASQTPQTVDNYSALNNIINMANAQGLAGGSVPTGIYQQPGSVGQMPQQLTPYPFGVGILDRMSMNANGYAPSF